MSLPHSAHSSGPARDAFRVVCLCAQWCATCREYRVGFESLVTDFPAIGFRWLDIEDEADELGDLDIENFPTLLLARGEAVLFFGTMPPQLGHLRRMLENFIQQTAQESLDYACSDAERSAWQDNEDLRRLGRRSGQ